MTGHLEAALLAALAGGPQTTATLAQGLGHTPARVEALLRDLRQRGAVRRMLLRGLWAWGLA